MNWTIWLGVISGAVSLYCLAFANWKSNKDTIETVQKSNQAVQKSNQETTEAVRAGIAKFSAQVNTVKESVSVQPSGVQGAGKTGTASPNVTSQQAQQKLDDINQRFAQWASNLIEERDLKKLSFEQQQLNARAAEIALSKVSPNFSADDRCNSSRHQCIQY